ncbi:hypothetical protein LshimejAT787_0704640 [Lyophyllum shimeji]|uniref:Uncharacterized protein n=1 Tax=Lyophyllum shimeji TaxID=47721 RepID=A0A9P3UM24_LYOSH|nr:hypothetical protein LshimejAT787_0704640 [Lyophyllum shimeji]
MGYGNDSDGGRDGSEFLEEKSCLMRGIGERERDNDRLKSGPWTEHIESVKGNVEVYQEVLKEHKRRLKSCRLEMVAIVPASSSASSSKPESCVVGVSDAQARPADADVEVDCLRDGRRAAHDK